MAKRKGSWKKGNAPAQGSTPQKISKPLTGTGKFTKSVSKGRKTAESKGTSPLDGRKRGKK